MNQRWMAIRILIGVLMLSAGMLADVTRGGAAPPAPASHTKEIRVRGEKITQRPDGTVTVTTLTTGEITHADTVFTAESIVMRSQKDVHDFTCIGNPKLVDPQSTITGDKVIGHSTPRWAEFIGNVKMITTPKPKSGSNTSTKIGSDPATITCEKLSYYYAAKRGEATGKVMIVQKQRTVWADQATYEQATELVTLRGNVRMRNTGADEVKEMKDAETVTVSLENDWIDIVAKKGQRIELIIEVQDDDEGTQPTPAPDKP